jgi:hypothetical protein
MIDPMETKLVGKWEMVNGKVLNCSGGRPRISSGVYPSIRIGFKTVTSPPLKCEAGKL